MTKHRSHSVAFKRQVAEEFIAGETLHALSKQHDISRQLIRIWVGKFEAGALDDDVQAADLMQEYEAKIAAGGWEGFWGMIGVDLIGDIRRAYFEQKRPASGSRCWSISSRRRPSSPGGSGARRSVCSRSCAVAAMMVRTTVCTGSASPGAMSVPGFRHTPTFR